MSHQTFQHIAHNTLLESTQFNLPPLDPFAPVDPTLPPLNPNRSHMILLGAIHITCKADLT